MIKKKKIIIKISFKINKIINNKINIILKKTLDLN